ncbi:polysaccharide biosynthesis C-terminal domain-containing protein, partial [Streptococcus orisratti]|uniref:polysaccharide biosynthesis C-terminal domain-containing protein n=1 Tax=Streptococcus orisratti TaxID=114652 RepID=UPI003D04594D
IWLASLYFIGFIIISAEGIITLLSGDGYLLATPTLQATIVTVLFVGLSAFLGTNILVSLGKERVTIRASFVGILINILLNLLLIPRLASLGAGIATVVGEASMVLYELLYLGKESHEYFDERNIAKILLVFTATFLITTFIYPSLSVLPIFFRLLVSGGLYSLIYGIGLYLVKENLVVDWVGGLLKRFKNS